MGGPTSSQEFCCTCLDPNKTKEDLISLNFVPAKDISYKFKLKCCVPEMVLENYEDSFLCNSCLAALETSYTFRCMCLRTEGKLAEFRQKHKNGLGLTSNHLGKIKIKQEVIEPPPDDDIPEDDHEIYFTEVIDAPMDIEVPTKKKRNVKKELEIDPFADVGNGINGKEAQTSTLTEGEPLQVDNDVLCPEKVPSNTSDLTAPNSVGDLSEVESTGLTDLEIIEAACKTIPELLAYNCDVSSLDCRVSLERITTPTDTVKLNMREYVKRHYNKKHKKWSKTKKEVNYWCHICVKFIAIGRRHRYNSHMLNHRNIKCYKCEKCTKEFTYCETLSKHKKECNGVLTPPKVLRRILPAIKIKTEENVEVQAKPDVKIDFKKVKIKKERYDVDNDWVDESKSVKYLKIDSPNSDSEARRSAREKTAQKQVYGISMEAFQCEICEYQSYKKHQYQVHMMKHFNDRRFECTKCPKRFFENWELNRHLRTVHLSSVVNKRPPPNSYDIQNITPLIARKTNISEHTDDTNDSESATFAKMLEPSVSLTVNTETVVTPVIQSIESLADDRITNNGAISFACKTCDLSFQSHNLLILHSQVHKTRSNCSVCGQSFTSNTELVQHMNTHSHTGSSNSIELYETHDPPKLPPKKKKKKKFFCTICNMEFASKDHANIHTGAKPYDCKVCGKEFAAYSTLRKHRWTHSDEPKTEVDDEEQSEAPPQRIKHSCNICQKIFANKWQINSHTCHSATGETVYRCQICKNVFIGRTALIDHMGMHVNQTGEFYQ